MLRNLKQFKLPEIEEKVLAFWKENAIFQKSLRNRKGKKKQFVFFEGPPTANGKPGIHHVLSRAFKDIILRYKTMQGYYVPRRAGWDTHGLPVEIEVEKELGLKNKKDIEKFGIAEFNAKAKSSVWKYKTEWEKLTERVGLWLDFKNPYITYENDYIESLWWVFQQIHKKGFLEKQNKIVPWCPRCQTALSSHELGQPGVYQRTKDPSLYVKFRIKNQESRIKDKEFLLVWTTTPWTLPANVAVAINPKLTYTKYKVDDEYMWSFSPPPAVEGKKVSVIEKMSGKRLVGLEYEPFYRIKNPSSAKASADKQESRIKNFYKVIEANFVSTEEGTGLVHIAPAYGEDDLAAFGNEGVIMTIDEDGKIKSGLGIPGEGKFIKTADKEIVADLEKRGLVHSFGTLEHEYPFCWRCGTLLIYMARLSWFITMSKLRDKMIAANKKVNWVPAHIKEGRFGEWLNELKDWAITRNRYWGTPLPIWECGKCNTHYVAGGLEDIKKRAYYRNTYYFVRHGEAEHNVKGIIASGNNEENGNGVHLTEKGKKQVQKTAQKLAKKKIEIIYSSPYARAKETANIIAKATGAKVITDKRLAEYNTGIFNGRPAKEHRAFYATPYEKWSKTPPGGETLTDILRRELSFLREIHQQHRDKKIVIVGHGDPLWILEGAMRGYDHRTTIEREREFYLDLGGVNEIAFADIPMNRDGELDFHRPFIDEIALACQKCGGKIGRVEGVADVWFDSGAMPFASVHYPFACAQTKSEKRKAKSIEKCLEFPADYITEGIDQTRGWFYTLLAVSVLLGKGNPYKNVVSLGLVLDKNGQKMSKSKGNAVDPWVMANMYGMDVVRWYFYTVNPPGESKRFDEQELQKTMRKVFMILYNSFIFYNTYGAARLTTSAGKPIKIMDEWILARLRQTASDVTKKLDDYDIQGAGRAIETLIDDLSRWYIRRTRKNVSPEVLKKVLRETAKLLAPFAPFFAEALYQSLDGKQSVHLEDWTEENAKSKTQSAKLLEAMNEVRALAAKAFAEREKVGIKVRQPLAVLRIKNKELRIKGNKELLAILAEEVNVKKVVIDRKIKDDVELDTRITPELKEEGLVREFVRMIQGLRQDARYQPEYKAIVMVEAPKELAGIVLRHESEIKKAVNAVAVEYKRQKIDADITAKIDGQEIWIGVRRK